VLSGERDNGGSGGEVLRFGLVGSAKWSSDETDISVLLLGELCRYPTQNL
jgi:hypothetical protein